LAKKWRLRFGFLPGDDVYKEGHFYFSCRQQYVPTCKEPRNFQ